MARRCDERLCLLAVAALWLLVAAPNVRESELTLSEKDRILILAPHPDDEVLGCSGIIQQAVSMHLPLRVVFLTHGDNNEWSFFLYRKRPVFMPGSVRSMGTVRHDEALAAAKLFGVPPEALTFLGYPDFGTAAIWRTHWDDQPPYKSMLTRVKEVPYKDALRPGAPYKGEEILRDLTTVLREFRPTKIFVSHPADHNGDHRALYLFTRVALWDLPGEMQPEVYPYLVHFANWPLPRGDHSDKSLNAPKELREQIRWQTVPLGPDEINRKRAALRAHRSQYSYSGKYLLSFVRANELFGDIEPVRMRVNMRGREMAEGLWGHVVETPEELTETERNAFVGLEQQFVRLEHANLVVTIRLSRPLGHEVEASLALFGYRNDRPFGKMPKLQVQLGEENQVIYDQGRKLSRQTIQIEREPRAITIRVPLDALGNPQKVLTSSRTYLADVPLDWLSWRILEMPELPSITPDSN
jgi:LmbE family N-acetylglucosaminyl deacetylase